MLSYPIKIIEYPQLRLLAWSLPHCDVMSGEDAFALYEREWRHVEKGQLQPHEHALIKQLTQEYGQGVMNV